MTNIDTSLHLPHNHPIVTPERLAKKDLSVKGKGFAVRRDHRIDILLQASVITPRQHQALTRYMIGGTIFRRKQEGVITRWLGERIDNARPMTQEDVVTLTDAYNKIQHRFKALPVAQRHKFPLLLEAICFDELPLSSNKRNVPCVCSVLKVGKPKAKMAVQAAADWVEKQLNEIFS